jgi:hypothetical protein
VGRSVKHFGKVLGGLLLVSGAGLAAPQYLGDDRMAVPPEYRDWVFLTSSLDLNYSTAKEPGPDQMHMLDNVFVDPQAYKAFLTTGTWPEQTVLVKENRIAESAGTLSKSGRFQTGVMDLEIHVKDSARFPGGWAFFVSSDGKADGKLMPQSANCYSCHQDHAAVDTTFVQFYPTLLGIAKDKGTLSTSYLKDSAVK